MASPNEINGFTVALERATSVTEHWVQLLNPGLIEQVNRAFADLQATAGTAFTGLFSEAIGFFRTLAGYVAPLFAQLKPIVDELAGTVFKALAAQVQTLLPIFEALLPVLRVITQLFDFLAVAARLFTSVVALGVQIMAEFVGFLATAITTALAPVFDVLKASLEGVSNVVRTVGIVLSALFEVLNASLQVLIGWELSDLVKEINDAFKELIKAIILTAVKIAYLIDQTLGDKLSAAILKRLTPGPGATAAGGTAIKNLESIGKDFALAAVNAAKGGASATETWQKEVAAILKDIRDNTKDVRKEALDKAKELAEMIPLAGKAEAAAGVAPGAGKILLDIFAPGLSGLLD